MSVTRNTYRILIGNPGAVRHLDLLLDLRIILKWIVSNGDCMSYLRWRFAVSVACCRVRRYGAAVLETGRWEETNLCASGRHFMVGVRRHTPAVCGQAAQQSNLFNDSVSTAQVMWRCRTKKIT
jgi:hypothetical protein